jgi:hypothetical protein
MIFLKRKTVSTLSDGSENWMKNKCDSKIQLSKMTFLKSVELCTGSDVTNYENTLLIPWCRIFFEKLVFTQLIKE